jgi:hypothetical protein
MVKPPLHCPRGYRLRPGHTLAMVSGWVLAIQAADATDRAGNISAGTAGCDTDWCWRRWCHAGRRWRRNRGGKQHDHDGKQERGCTAEPRECGPSSHYHQDSLFRLATSCSSVVLSDARRTQKLPRSTPAYSRSAYPRGGSIACSCGRHLTWRCECGAVTYGPPLGEGCSLLNGSARMRWASQHPITMSRTADPRRSGTAN